MTLGVVIGKFYPPHRGHHFLINTAISQVDELTVIVCDKQGQSIPGETRAQWLREVHPDAYVIVVPDVLTEDDSEAWARYTVKVLGRAPDVVFTSEDYGTAYAQFMGSQHVLVDRKRSKVPVSATLIRSDPQAYDLPPIVGPLIMRVRPGLSAV
jgi:NadR type nicotinamide-nucleotide adenylyltransferase